LLARRARRQVAQAKFRLRTGDPSTCLHPTLWPSPATPILQEPNPAYQPQPQAQPGYGYAPQPGQQQPMYVQQQPGQAPVGYGTAQPQYVMGAAAPMQQPMMMAAQPGMVVAPAGYAVVPLLAPDLISAIGRLSGSFVTQKVNLAEAITDGAFQQQNRYKVSAWDPVAGREQPKAGKGGDLIKMKETSDCCIRLLCGPARPFKIAIYADDPSIGTYRKDGEPLLYPDAMVIERPFRCTMLCLCRPIAKVRCSEAWRSGGAARWTGSRQPASRPPR
jgi:hypothetical protein